MFYFTHIKKKQNIRQQDIVSYACCDYITWYTHNKCELFFKIHLSSETSIYPHRSITPPDNPDKKRFPQTTESLSHAEKKMSLFSSVHCLFAQMNSDYVQPHSSCCKWSLYKYYWTWTTKVFPHYDINFILPIIRKICHSFITLNRKSVVYFCKNLQSIYLLSKYFDFYQFLFYLLGNV